MARRIHSFHTWQQIARILLSDRRGPGVRTWAEGFMVAIATIDAVGSRRATLRDAIGSRLASNIPNDIEGAASLSPIEVRYVISYVIESGRLSRYLHRIDRRSHKRIWIAVEAASKGASLMAMPFLTIYGDLRRSPVHAAWDWYASLDSDRLTAIYQRAVSYRVTKDRTGDVIAARARVRRVA